LTISERSDILYLLTDFFSNNEEKGTTMERDYILMNKNLPLTSFHLKDIGSELFTLSNITQLHDSPYNAEVLEELLVSRKPAKNREYLEKLLQQMRINSISEYLDISYGLSLNDTLWFKPADADDSITWDSVNHYTNTFNVDIAEYMLTGQALAGLHVRTTSPEFGTNGILPKCWHREEDGQIYLYKGGTSGCCNTGNEPYSEYMCSSILAAMGMKNFVPYTLKCYYGHLVSSCPMFTSKEVGYTPVCNYSNPKTFMQIVSLFESLGLREQFEDHLIFDALVYNTDRHLNNYGFLRDNDTYKVVGMVPIFDNGCGMLPYYTLDRDIDEYAKKYDYQNSGLSNDDIFALCLKDRHKKMLSHLIDFTFPKHPLFDLPEERIKRLEDLLQRRIQYILSK
jgi:hypothetical protein